ncbi:sterol reductase/lamin B receptor, partial [Aaosphaeria arxii CBS 175.79]
QEVKAVDGWVPGTDPKIDHTGHFEFGGPLGTTAMMVGFPLLMYYMWIGATFYDGHFPLPASQSITDFLVHMANLVSTHAFPNLRAWTIYWTFFILQALGYSFLPGVTSYGKPLDHEDGKQLEYHCSAIHAFYYTIVGTSILHVTGLFPLYTIIDEFGPLLSVAIISGFLVATVAYTSAIIRGAQHRMTGYFLYDFFMGAELNPRIGNLDFKMFFMVRMPWFILLSVTCATAARQYHDYGYISAEVGFMVFAHLLYANACAKGEECIVKTWDIYYEKWGFMLIFWNLAGVPLSYCHATLYMANHLDTISDWSYPALRTPLLVLLFTSYCFVYWVWDTCGSHKHRFRAAQRGETTTRKTFPQLPWQTLNNPAVLTTPNGESILVGGWYAYARKIHYTCDVYFAVTWGLICGFESPFPWFYPVFFTVMIMHRAYRDIQRCRAKYGDTWKEFERRTPYLFIPVSLAFFHQWAFETFEAN